MLRREFQTFGVRESCGIGMCGACTVLVDGRAISSCLVLAGLAGGLAVETVEGLGTTGALHPIQQAFVDHSGFQCSYCTPGFIMATKALLAENPNPTADEVRHGLAGNLCRCGSYSRTGLRAGCRRAAPGRARGRRRWRRARLGRPGGGAAVSAGLAIHRPRTLDAAIELLGRYGDDARIVAGSTAVTIMVRQRLIAPAALVSITGIDGLDGIRRVDAHLEIGSLTTHRELELSPLIRETIPVLAETFGLVANVRVRNVATLGGVLAEADYASDPPAVFLALDAEIVARGPGGERTIPIASFFRAFYETALADDEVADRVRRPDPRPQEPRELPEVRDPPSEDRPCVGVFAASAGARRLDRRSPGGGRRRRGDAQRFTDSRRRPGRGPRRRTRPSHRRRVRRPHRRARRSSRLGLVPDPDDPRLGPPGDRARGHPRCRRLISTVRERLAPGRTPSEPASSRPGSGRRPGWRPAPDRERSPAADP